MRWPGEEGKMVDPRGDPRGERGESLFFFWKLFPRAKLLLITRVTNQLGCGGPGGGTGIPNKSAHQITKETFESQALLPYLLFEGLCPSPEKPSFCGCSPFLHCSADPLHWVRVCEQQRLWLLSLCIPNVIAPSADRAGSASSFWGYRPHTMLWAGEQ